MRTGAGIALALALTAAAACGGKKQSSTAAAPATPVAHQDADELFARCTRRALEGAGFESIECPDLVFELNRNPTPDLDAVVRTLVQAHSGGGEGEPFALEVSGRSYRARRYHAAGGQFRHALAAHTQIDSSPGFAFACSEAQENRARCLAVARYVIENGMPQLAAAAQAFAGVAVALPAQCQLVGVDSVSCSDGARMTWRRVATAPAALELRDNHIAMLDRLAKAKEARTSGGERPCSTLGQPTSCRVDSIELPDGTLWVAATVLERNGDHWTMVCTWQGTRGSFPEVCHQLVTLEAAR